MYLKKLWYKTHITKFTRNLKKITVLADRPERCAINYILHHNGLTTKRWRYAGSIDQDNFPSCHKCFINRINNIDSYVYVTCQQCCDWNYNSTSRRIRQLPPEISYISTQRQPRTTI